MIDINNIPTGWAISNLENIVTEGQIGLVRSKKEQSYDEGYPYIRMQHYDMSGCWNFKDLTKVNATSEEVIKYELRKGDVLFNTRNSYELVGKVAIWNFDKSSYLYNNNILRLRFFEDILPNWMAYQMIAPSFRRTITSSKSATTSVCAIYGKDLFCQNILLPPLNEQKRIVAKIEALQTRSSAVKEELEAIKPLLDQFRQSVLASAFRGDLTKDWRSQNPDVEPAEKLFKNSNDLVISNKPISKTWIHIKLNSLINKIQAGKNFKCPEIPVNQDTVGLVKISAVTWGRFNPQETKTVVDESKINPDLFINQGDFLVSRANTIELVGASVIVEEIDYQIMISCNDLKL